MSSKHYKVLGLMSGTSLDGLDLAYCIFKENKGKWSYSIQKAITYPYPDQWKERIHHLRSINAESMAETHMAYGRWIAEQINHFLEEQQLEMPDLIGSHGHTVFHKPEEGYTLQIGEGSCIARATTCKVVSDFRTQDVALGGQGAPLVPIGDRLLFGDWDACVNLGGFANLSYENGGERIAYDICPINVLLNPLANQLGLSYDDKGMLARKGEMIPDLFSALEQLDFYRQDPPKSLGMEWVKEQIWPLLDLESYDTGNLLHTLTEHMAVRIATALKNKKRVLFTGGGSWNDYLMDRIGFYHQEEIVIPDALLVDYKESLIFALLAVLKTRDEVNCLKSVTGAIKDHSTGVVHHF